MYAARRVAPQQFGDSAAAWRRGPYLLGDTDGSARNTIARNGLGSITSIIGGIVGGAIGGPAGAAVGTSIGGGLTSFTGNQDQQRQQRVNWMLQAAQAGSTLAAAIIYAGPHNTASHEQSMWANAWAAIPGAVQNAALGQYPNGFWPTGAPFDMPTQRAQIVAQLQALGVPATNNPTSPTTGAGGLPIQPLPGTGGFGTPPLATGGVMLPGMSTIAGYNWLPLVLIGGAAIVALTTSKRGRR